MLQKYEALLVLRENKPKKTTTMKRFLLIIAVLCLSFSAYAQKNIEWTDAQKLNHTGKMCKTKNPYNRVEVNDYPELNKTEANLLKTCAGQAIMFETDAKEIWVKADYGYRGHNRAMPATAGCGFNLFIEHEGEWKWAASVVNGDGHDKDGNSKIEKPLRVIKNMDGSTHRCILYLPLFA